jgi:hypothetical protein
MTKPAYQVIIALSTDDDELFENAKTFDDALKVYNEHSGDCQAEHLTSFNTEDEMKAFIQGYSTAIGFLGSGMVFTNIDRDESLKLDRIRVLGEYLNPEDSDLSTQYDILVNEELDGDTLLGDVEGVFVRYDFAESTVDNLFKNLLP